ncbi:hypothetical protein [Roseicella aquatilis]|uniref:Alpha/beta hydrolase n=1 Tax=Roseicella aquatilis TaxID=2527868 RepID=A0A4R4D3V1_9PROT|nr:hypothetical protein [Roseicella aquatilis]TCZ53601.1 hypothetical protein EXY23_24490 [Roseicella aquatilis]
MSAPDRRVLFDNGQTVIRHAPAGTRSSGTLVVTFTGMFENDPSQPGCAEILLHRQGHDLICVQKRSESWFQDLDVEDFRQAVAPLLGRYDDVACYGLSMGAFAALYYGGAIDAAILAVSPLVSIHPRFPQMGLRELRKAVTIRHVDLREVPKSRKPCLILYDPQDEPDELYMTHEVIPAFPEARILRLRYTAHPCAQALHEMGVYRSLMFGFLEDRTMPGARALLRPHRGRSGRYLQRLARGCAKRGHRAWALALYDRALAVTQRPDTILPERDALAAEMGLPAWRPAQPVAA